MVEIPNSKTPSSVAGNYLGSATCLDGTSQLHICYATLMMIATMAGKTTVGMDAVAVIWWYRFCLLML